MKLNRCFLILLCILTLAVPFRAQAQEAKTYAVLPFEVHGPDKYRHLRQGIQSMLITRLHWEERFLPVEKAKINSVLQNTNGQAGQAEGIRSALEADYLIGGSVTIVGQEASLDVRVQGPGKDWSRSEQTQLDRLIPTLETFAGEINSAVFKRPEPAAEKEPAEQEQQTAAAASNPQFIMNESETGSDFYLNPGFQYSGSATPGKIRTQSLPFASMGCIAGDVNNDGVTELLFLEEHKVHAFVFEQNKLKPIDTYETSQAIDSLNINILDLNRDGLKEIIVSAVQEEPRRMFRSYMLNLKDGKFSVFAEQVDMFFNVVRTPPDYIPTLVGQRPGWGDVFDAPVYEVVRMNDEFTLSRKLSLPSKVNVFNFVYLPQAEGYKLITVDSRDKLRVYDEAGSLQHTTMESFAGSSIGLEVTDTMPGLGEVKESEKDSKYYYLPLRLVTTNLNNDPQHELLVNKNISMASQFFGRYRSFPQGEIHSMYWDGIGLSLLWKTRRIKGTVVDYGIEDINNDGQKDLYVCIDSYPGVTGFKTVRTFLQIYPLSMDKVSPDAPVSRDIDE